MYLRLVIIVRSYFKSIIILCSILVMFYMNKSVNKYLYKSSKLSERIYISCEEEGGMEEMLCGPETMPRPSNRLSKALTLMPHKNRATLSHETWKKFYEYIQIFNFG